MIRALPITNKKMEKIEQLDKFQFCWIDKQDFTAENHR
jgi:hypothetical protein